MPIHTPQESAKFHAIFTAAVALVAGGRVDENRALRPAVRGIEAEMRAAMEMATRLYDGSLAQFNESIPRP